METTIYLEIGGGGQATDASVNMPRYSYDGIYKHITTSIGGRIDLVSQLGIIPSNLEVKYSQYTIRRYAITGGQMIIPVSMRSSHKGI